MNVIKEALLNRRLNKALASHRCRLSSGIKSLRDGAKLILEPGVKLGKAEIFSRELEIGAYTDVVSGCEFLDVAQIGRYCSIAADVVIGQARQSHPIDWLTTHHFASNARLIKRPIKREHPYRPTVIGHDVWIGRDVLILDGVSIGTGAIIGAQSLVNVDVPPYAIVAGTPARVIRYRFEQPLIERLLASRWWELPLEVLGELPLDDPQACLSVLERQASAPRSLPGRLQINSKPFAIEELQGRAAAQVSSLIGASGA
ncbi:CatB-related O-acetyltransferase [Pseudomonas sp. CAN2814]|uniref:CatB-related O-acetyltransferase n=1 Tax=Pseudomonas sp. CAN1 TaxID=3046726 RepID=UPI002649BF73|nr:CatB-related O-acetyltransferase [Pseudomonas sp. CAN1]MDN6856517.1 CatB-related O-acetyltransferase [Pseudomonas sp. CAN1]